MGTFFFAEDYYGFDDAFYAAVKVLEIINNNDKKLSDLVDEIPGVFNTPEIRIECDDNKKFDIISKINERQKRNKKKIINIDGVRVSEKDGWWLLRASNTQPAIVLRCESLTQDGLEYQKRSVKDELSRFNITLHEK